MKYISIKLLLKCTMDTSPTLMEFMDSRREREGDQIQIRQIPNSTLINTRKESCGAVRAPASLRAGLSAL